MLSETTAKRYWAPPCRGPWATVPLHGGARVMVRPAIIEAVKAMDAVFRRYDYRAYANQTGAQNCRRVKGISSMSLHAYGIAIDVNWSLNPYGGYRRHIPDHVARAVCSIRTNNGKQVWGWGGYWSGKKDWMHFSICCTPGDLATGINWRTVTGTPSGHIPAPPSRTPTPKPAPTKPAPPQFPIFQDEGDDEDMRLLRDHTGAVWILSGRTRKHVKTANEYKALSSTWMPHHDLGPGSPFFNPIVSQVILNYTDAV
mgnify:FL=1